MLNGIVTDVLLMLEFLVTDIFLVISLTSLTVCL